MRHREEAKEYADFCSSLSSGSEIEKAEQKIQWWKNRYPDIEIARQYIEALRNGATGVKLTAARRAAIDSARYADIHIGYNTYMYINAAVLENAAAWIY